MDEHDPGRVPDRDPSDPTDGPSSIAQVLPALTDDAALILTLAAVLRPGTPLPVNIPRNLFSKLSQGDQARTEQRFSRAISDLQNRGLATRSANADGGDLLEIPAAVIDALMKNDLLEGRADQVRQSMHVVAISGVSEALGDPDSVVMSRERELLLEHGHYLAASGATVEDALLAGWLARNAHARGDAKQALELGERAATTLARINGPDDEETLKASVNLALYTGRTGRVEEALQKLKLLVPAIARKFGPEHEFTLVTRGNYASMMERAGDHFRAYALLTGIERDMTRVLGADHNETLRARNSAAVAAAAMGQPGIALAREKELLAARERSSGPEDPATLRVRQSLAVMTGLAGDARSGLKSLEELLPIQTRVLGADHSETLVSRNFIARFTAVSGNAPEAIAQYEALIPDLVRVLGDADPETRWAREQLAYLRDGQQPRRTPPQGTMTLPYHQQKYEAVGARMAVGCLLSVVQVGGSAITLWLLLWKHDLRSTIWMSVVVVAAVFAEYGLSSLRLPVWDRAIESQRSQEEAKGWQADAVSRNIVDTLRAGGRSAPKYWLFLRAFQSENRVPVVSTFNEDLHEQPGYRAYGEVSLFDPDREPVDLFDGLQDGLRRLTSTHFLAVGERIHFLHSEVGFVETTDDAWRADVERLVKHADLVITAPGATPGVLWETETIARNALEKSLFIMPPSYTPVATVKHDGLLMIPWFDRVASNEIDHARATWDTAMRPLSDCGLVVPPYNCNGALFFYTHDRTIVTLRIPVRFEEFGPAWEIIESALPGAITPADRSRA